MTTPPLPVPGAPPWPYCAHGAEPAATDPIGCRGVHVPGHTACLAHLDPTNRDAYLAGLTPGTDVDHRGTSFTEPLLNALLRALRDPGTGHPRLGEARFWDATFQGDAGFESATFQDYAEFEAVTFKGNAEFGSATFEDFVHFESATFEGHAGFGSAIFMSYTGFVSTTFMGSAFFRSATFRGDAEFESADFKNVAWCESVTFKALARFEAATFKGDAGFEAATFEGLTEFDSATFEDYAEFGATTFQSTAKFGAATFQDCAGFGAAVFDGYAEFGAVTFKEHAEFGAATFKNGAGFGAAVFDGYAEFGAVTFKEHAEFGAATFKNDAQFEQAVFERSVSLGPLVCAGRVKLSGVVFSGPVTLSFAARRLECRRTRWSSTAELRLRYATVDFAHTVFEYPLTIATEAAPFVLADGQPVAEEALAGTPDATVRIASLRGVDAAHLVLADVDLSGCLFTGTVHLDQVRLEGTCSFDAVPPGTHWQRWHLVRYTQRRTLAEEHHWRAKRPTAVPGWNTAVFHSGHVGPAQLAPVYRALRKALEDAKNEPGAADFYFGEMEMRRHDRTGATRAERGLLHGYWLLSGYGLRASRALGWLGAAMLVTIVLLMGFGIPKGSPKQEVTGTVPPGGGKVAFEIEKEDPQNPAGNRFTSERFERALNVTLNSVVFRSSGQDLTTAGTYTEMTSRVLEPTLLALAVLAVRGRIKR
ncbi:MULTISPECIES: pentapeptide repeat-containing protein [unclassified Streptomyces]|uniref:pentapeptide repeat-containing protein n=1 Tax=unclassified Streptomyces TaxID=2593676 RepID=UPI0036512AD8